MEENLDIHEFASPFRSVDRKTQPSCIQEVCHIKVSNAEHEFLHGDVSLLSLTKDTMGKNVVPSFDKLPATRIMHSNQKTIFSVESRLEARRRQCPAGAEAKRCHRKEGVNTFHAMAQLFGYPQVSTPVCVETGSA
eukprot:361250-Chlamydomonas_euryale.AAC.27